MIKINQHKTSLQAMLAAFITLLAGIRLYPFGLFGMEAGHSFISDLVQAIASDALNLVVFLPVVLLLIALYRGGFNSKFKKIDTKLFKREAITFLIETAIFSFAIRSFNPDLFVAGIIIALISVIYYAVYAREVFRLKEADHVQNKAENTQ